MVEFTGRSVDCINLKINGEDCQQKFDINGTSLYTVVRPTMCTLQTIISADVEPCQSLKPDWFVVEQKLGRQWR